MLDRRPRTVVALAAFALGVASCSGSNGNTAELVRTIELDAGAEPTALVALDDGQLAIGERLTGRIIAVDVENPDERALLATVDVDPDAEGQRGLLGVAAIGGDLYAAWTRTSDGRLVVAQVGPGPERLVWEGPPSVDRANGGHLAVDEQGMLVIGVGDLGQPELAVDPSAPNSKLLSLDPSGPPDQEPLVLSDGWNNPFAFTVTSDGDIWVADNAPRDDPERIGRGDGAAPLMELPGQRAPSALISLGRGRLGLCGYLDGDLVEVRLVEGPVLGDVLSDGTCRTGAVVLDTDLVAVTDGEAVRVLRIP